MPAETPRPGDVWAWAEGEGETRAEIAAVCTGTRTGPGADYCYVFSGGHPGFAPEDGFEHWPPAEARKIGSVCA